MKKEYIKPIIIHIKTWNDEALLQTASLYNINEVDPDENIALLFESKTYSVRLNVY